MSRNRRVIATVGLTALFLACAQVPKESVTLSATVGRDMAEMQRAHLELADLYFQRLESDINTFVDDVYAPFQIQETAKQFKPELVSAIENASRPDSSPQAQQDLLSILGIYLEELRTEIESYRRSLLEPIEVQKAALLSEIESSYTQIHYANSIVTGHLSSVVRVHEAQSELLQEVGIGDLRTRLGTKTAEVSDQIRDLVLEGRSTEAKIGKLSEKLQSLVARLGDEELPPVASEKEDEE